MTDSPRMGWPIPTENFDPWYEAFIAMVGAMDASAFAAREDRNVLLIGGGTVSYSVDGGSGVGTFTWSAPIEFTSLTGFFESLPAGSIGLLDRQMMYVTFVRAPTGAVNVSAAAAYTLPQNDSALVVCVRVGTKLYFRNGRVIVDGDSSADGIGSGAAFSLLSILTVNGDLLTRSSDAVARLGVEPNGYQLKVRALAPQWVKPSSYGDAVDLPSAEDQYEGLWYIEKDTGFVRLCVQTDDGTWENLYVAAGSTAGDARAAIGAGSSDLVLSPATPQPLGTPDAGSSGKASDAGHIHALPSRSDLGVQDGPRLIPITMFAANDGVLTAVGRCRFDPSVYAIPGRSTMISFELIGDVDSGGVTGTAVLRNLTDSTTDSTITVTETTPTWKTGVVMPPGGAKIYEIRLSHNGSPTDTFTVGGAVLRVTWS